MTKFVAKPGMIESIEAAASKELRNVSASPDEQTRQEEDFAAALGQTQIEGMKQDIGERKTYAKRIFVLVSAWVGAMFAMLVLQGFGGRSWFILPQPVLLAAIGSTTVNVLGLFYIVAHYLFPNPNGAPREKSVAKRAEK